MNRPPGCLRLAAAIPLALIVNAGLASSASAHVKWFASYNVAGQPIGLEHVLCHDLEFLAGVSVLALMAGCLMERTSLGFGSLRAMDRVTTAIENNIELIFRAGCGFFFIAIWGVGGMILTPELKTTSAAVGAIQLMIAAGMLSRRTMPVSAFGIVILYAIALWNYGLFHMADYPVFLGIAAYVALIGLQRDFFGIRPIDIVRWSAGITLMWASVEKWAYPEWSFPLFAHHPQLAMGFQPAFFMRAAGAVEFALAFALMWTPLVRRVAAVMLISMFVGAVLDFGKVDLIGHTLIVVALLGIVSDRGRTSDVVRYPWLLPVGYTGALTTFLTAYYLVHAVIYGTTLT